MVARKICVHAGLIPHARHDGIGVLAVTLDGSWVGGSGLEKVQIGQIHVALWSAGVTGVDERTGEGLAPRGDDDTKPFAEDEGPVEFPVREAAFR